MDKGTEVRATLERLMRQNGEDYASLSRLIGRNAAYIQQFIKRGSPRMLAERDRALLARYFCVDETVLGAPPREDAPRQPNDLVVVSRYDVGASAGGGSDVGADAALAGIAFDPRWLRQSGARPQSLSVIRVQGDSMAPTLCHGDDIMVNRDDGADRLREGIYVLRRDGDLFVKRIARSAGQGRVAILSDNTAYPPIEDCPISELTIIGRVLWTGRLVV